MSDCPANNRKEELCRILAVNLSTIRARANISQNELAERLGFKRQTISAIESKQRDMQWSTFSAIILFFSKDNEVKKLLSFMGLLDDDVKETLNIL